MAQVNQRMDIQVQSDERERGRERERERESMKKREKRERIYDDLDCKRLTSSLGIYVSKWVIISGEVYAYSVQRRL